MKNKLFTVAALSFCGCLAYAQVGINTPTPSAMMDVVTKGNTAATKALEINNSSNTEMVTVLNNGNVGINVANPNAKLHIVSSSGNGFQLVDGSQGANKVLTSDANGVGTWQTASAAGITSITGTSPITASTASGATTIGIDRNNIAEGTSASGATDAFVLSGGITSSVVGGSDISLTVNNTAPLWNANQLQGTAISNTAPTANQVLTFNGTNWAPTTPAAATADWQITGNNNTTASSTALGTAPNNNFIGTTSNQNLAVVTNTKVHGILDTNGTLTGGGENLSSFTWGVSNSIDPTNNGTSIALGSTNTVKAPGIGTAAVAIGHTNSVTVGGYAIGRDNKLTSGTQSLAIGFANEASTFGLGSGAAFLFGVTNKVSGTTSSNTFAFGKENNVSTNNSMIIGYNGMTAKTNSTTYANSTHYFYGSEATANPTSITAKTQVAINVPAATALTGNSDLFIQNSIKYLPTAVVTTPQGTACGSTEEGAIKYFLINSNTGAFFGCIRTGGTSYTWSQLNL